MSNGLYAATAAAASAAICLLLLHVPLAPSHLLLFGVGVVTAAQWLVLKKATGTPLPLAGLLITIVNAIGALGVLYFPALANRAFIAAEPPSPGLYAGVGSVFALASMCLLLGALAVLPLLPKVAAAVGEKHRSPLSSASGEKAAAGAALLTMAALVGGYTWSGLLTRQHYSLVQGVGVLAQVSQLLQPISFALLGFALSRTRGSSRILLAALAAGLGLLVLATGSRSLSLAPAALALGVVAARQGSGRRNVGLLVVVGLCTAVALQLPLALRSPSVGGAGIEPYLAFMAAEPEIVFAPEVILSIAGNILYAVPLTAMSAAVPLEGGWLWTSVSPLPGFLTDWPLVQPRLRINAYTPMNGLGELASHGIPVLVTYFTVVGAVVTAAERHSVRLSRARRRLISLLHPSLIGLAGLLLLQYNLRSGTRLFWYMIAITLLVRLPSPLPSIRRNPTWSRLGSEQVSAGR